MIYWREDKQAWVESSGRLVHDAMRWAILNNERDGAHVWLEGGKSRFQEEARRTAEQIAALAATASDREVGDQGDWEALHGLASECFAEEAAKLRKAMAALKAISSDSGPAMGMRATANNALSEIEASDTQHHGAPQAPQASAAAWLLDLNRRTPEYGEALVMVGAETPDAFPVYRAAPVPSAPQAGVVESYEKAVWLVVRDRRPSTSYIQRRLQIGFNLAASYIERMEKEGIVTAPDKAGKRHLALPVAPGGSGDE